MEDAYNIAAAKSRQSMETGRKRYNERAFATDLKPGDRVLVKRLLERGGPGKLRSFWEDDVYIVARRPDVQNAVYEVELEKGTGRKRTLHRNSLLPYPFLPYEADTNDLTKVRHRYREQEENPSHSDSVGQSEVEVSSDDWEDDVGLDPNQLEDVAQHINEQSGLATAAEETDIEIQIRSPDEESNAVMDDRPNDEGPNNVTVNTPMPPPSDIFADETFEPRPKRTRNPPVMFSYYGLGKPADIQGHIQTISPQVVPMPVAYNRPPMAPQYCNQYVYMFPRRGYGPPMLRSSAYFQPQPCYISPRFYNSGPELPSIYC